MRFKLAFALSFFVIFSACSLSIDEKPPKKHIPEYEGKYKGCLEGYNKRIRSYFKGEYTKKETSQLIHCAMLAFESFKTRAIGEVPGEHTSFEIRDFLDLALLGMLGLDIDRPSDTNIGSGAFWKSADPIKLSVSGRLARNLWQLRAANPLKTS